ncbi:MAG: hypothetical protein DHS20C21_06530 [Gemmatimonadota bacterium]|nr:MAG: hypothetical protein DHS20C21_06530 [Gemmatimonadota bacterium]
MDLYALRRTAALLAGLVLAAGCGPATTATTSSPATPAAPVAPVAPAEPEVEGYRQAIFLGDQYRASGLPVKAAEEYEKALALDPEKHEVYPRLGYALIEAKQFERAIKIYNRYVDLAPKECEPHASLGFAYLKQNLTDQAIASYERALELCPDDPNAYTNLGKVYMEGGYDIEAIEAFRRSVELNPDDIFGFDTLGKLYFDRKLYPEAIVAYESILAHPNHQKDARWIAWANGRVAAMYKWADAYEQAIPHYRAVVESAEADEAQKTRAIRGLATSYEKTEQMALAIELYEKLTVQVPDDASYFYRLGELLNDVGRHQEAIDYAKMGQKVDPNCAAHGFCVMGQAYEKQGGLANFKRAEREFKRAVQCGDPRFTEYARKQIERQKQLGKIEELKRQKEQQGY